MGCELTAEEIAHIDRTIDDLKDENARLRSCLSDDAENARMIMAENAKLRELVRDMLACINNVSAHDTYCWDYCDFCKMYITKGRCDFESRMQELGVEP